MKILALAFIGLLFSCAWIAASNLLGVDAFTRGWVAGSISATAISIGVALDSRGVA